MLAPVFDANQEAQLGDVEREWATGPWGECSGVRSRIAFRVPPLSKAKRESQLQTQSQRRFNPELARSTLIKLVTPTTQQLPKRSRVLAFPLLLLGIGSGQRCRSHGKSDPVDAIAAAKACGCRICHPEPSTWAFVGVSLAATLDHIADQGLGTRCVSSSNPPFGIRLVENIGHDQQHVRKLLALEAMSAHKPYEMSDVSREPGWWQAQQHWVNVEPVDPNELLCVVAKRLISIVRASDTVARVESDEFIVLLTRVRGTEDATLAAQKIHRLLREPYDLAGNPIRSSASVGVTFAREDDDSESLLSRADSAIYHAKSEGGDRVEVKA